MHVYIVELLGGKERPIGSELADVWGWLVGGEEEEDLPPLPHGSTSSQ
jgi:hypothetical protein